MTSQIRTTVEQSMRNHGLGNEIRRAEPIIADLERKEREVVQNLVQFATSQGLSREQAVQALAQVGLSTDDVGGVYAVPTGQGEDLNAIVTRLAGTVDRLVEFARQNGFRD